MFIDVQISNKIIKFQLDSGASTSVITKKTYEMLGNPKLENYKKSLFAYGHTRLNILGQIITKIKCGENENSTTSWNRRRSG